MRVLQRYIPQFQANKVRLIADPVVYLKTVISTLIVTLSICTWNYRKLLFLIHDSCLYTLGIKKKKKSQLYSDISCVLILGQLLVLGKNRVWFLHRSKYSKLICSEFWLVVITPILWHLRSNKESYTCTQSNASTSSEQQNKGIFCSEEL